MPTQDDAPETAEAPPEALGALSLERFMPYRLAVLAHEVSGAVAQLYGERFNLSRAEWRVLAALGERGAMTAREISDYSTLDKMQVSRAVNRMLAEKLVAGGLDAADRRRKILRLTKKGETLFGRISPLALARESFILSALTPEELRTFDKVVDKLIQKARELQQWG
ncbi:hypothetical protein CH339_11500 [Rhodobium orientis]|uniref:HTH marR-type domain-containing protein n=2 Tax=Rhodobium orientis TaxID=34017 RepID=A0A327JQD9_9HYPH|nr:hypothetical protein [Rhodobium orientis]RAI27092.1 hypothetical protein CH339_11500 [Rhodobium orientis]